MSTLQIFNCFNIDIFTKSLVLNNQQQLMINTLSDKLQLLYNNNVKNDSGDSIKHAFNNICYKIFKKQLGGKNGRYSKKGGNNNISKYDILSIISFISGLFVIGIAICKAHELCSNVGPNISIIEEFKQIIDAMNDEDIGYIAYVYNLISGTAVASIISKRTDLLYETIYNEMKDSALYIGKTAISQCSLDKPTSMFGVLTNIVQTYTSGTRQVECILNATSKLTQLEFNKKLNNSVLLLTQTTNTIFTVKDLFIKGLGLITPSVSYIRFRYKQITHNKPIQLLSSTQVEQIEGGRKNKKRKNKKSTTKKRKNKKGTTKKRTTKKSKTFKNKY